MPEPKPLFEALDRPPPRKIKALARNGRHYAQRVGSYDDTIGQCGGLIDVFDDATGALVATIKVYDNARAPGLEGDVQDVFFESMCFDRGGALIVVDELGRRFAVDVESGTSTPIP